MRAKNLMATLAALLLCAAIGCTSNKANTPDVKDQVSKALANAGYKDVKVATNNDKQLVTLTGDVKTQEEKDKAEELAKSAAPGYVVAVEIGVRPEGVESAAKKIDSNVDDAIEKDFKAVIIANRLEKQHIRFDAKNGVLTLKGDVDTPGQRQQVEKLAATVPNVQQVVNELDVKGAKRRTS
ncbi:MAG TPA: BON domain-containing protein [Candidatus Angelobacter sp.]|jgi:osmotically-inducible protein OsmY|nr:BON domain-containing protein [Candidatus Angelobacter sp.]